MLSKINLFYKRSKRKINRLGFRSFVIQGIKNWIKKIGEFLKWVNLSVEPARYRDTPLARQHRLRIMSNWDMASKFIENAIERAPCKKLEDREKIDFTDEHNTKETSSNHERP